MRSRFRESSCRPSTFAEALGEVRAAIAFTHRNKTSNDATATAPGSGPPGFRPDRRRKSLFYGGTESQQNIQSP
jgi:hypothetical protein